MGKKGGKRSGHVPIESRDGQISTTSFVYTFRLGYKDSCQENPWGGSYSLKTHPRVGLEQSSPRGLVRG
jgi:hypothetical protein